MRADGRARGLAHLSRKGLVARSDLRVQVAPLILSVPVAHLAPQAQVVLRDLAVRLALEDKVFRVVHQVIYIAANNDKANTSP